MMTLLIILVLVAAGIAVWRFRVPLLARLLGQSESRIDRQLGKRKR